MGAFIARRTPGCAPELIARRQDGSLCSYATTGDIADDDRWFGSAALQTAGHATDDGMDFLKCGEEDKNDDLLK